MTAPDVCAEVTLVKSGGHCGVLCRSLYSSLVGLRPMAFLCFELPPGSFDVNVTPDKRSVFVQREVALVSTLQQVCVDTWGTVWEATDETDL